MGRRFPSDNGLVALLSEARKALSLWVGAIPR
jgi:hypothetical protein